MSSTSSRMAERSDLPGGALRARSVVHGLARGWALVGTVACLLALLAAGQTQAAPGGAGQVAVSVKTAALQGKWGDVWLSMHPGQRAFITRSLFVQCKSKVKIPSSSPNTIHVVSVTGGLSPVPGVAGPKARVSTVKVRIDYGDAAPSQTSVVRVTRVGNAWYMIDDASSKKAFTTENFC